MTAASPGRMRRLLAAGAPAAAGLALNALHQSVDAYFVAGLGAAALAGVSLAAPLLGLTAAFGVGLGAGTCAEAARAAGAGRAGAGSRLVAEALAAALALGAAAAAGLTALRGPLLALLGAEGEILPHAEAYLGFMAICAGLGIVQILADFIAFSEGRAGFAMRSLALCFGLNMALDPLLIHGAGMGTAGAGLATMLAQIAALSMHAGRFLRGDSAHRLILRRPGRPLARAMRIGAPEGGAMLLSGAGTALLLALAAHQGGTAGAAAMGVGLRALLLGLLPVEGFCLGVQPLLAHAFGAGDAARLRADTRATLLLAGGAATVAGALVGIAAAPLAGLFLTGAPAALARTTLLMILPALLLAGPRLVLLIRLQAEGRARAAAILSLAPMGWALALLLPPLVLALGYPGAPLALGLAAGGTGAAALFFLLPLLRAPHAEAPAMTESLA